MKLTFLGTRGNITRRNKYHYYHSSLLINHKRTKILIDCGSDWLNIARKAEHKPNAIFITHAHPDHSGGLVNGSNCEVYATKDGWKTIKNYKIDKEFRKILKIQKPITIGKIKIVAFKVDHSLNAPAVGYKISDFKNNNLSFFYVPDLIKIHEQKEALSGVQIYIGDGAIVARTLLEHKRNHKKIGHTSIEKQLKWCKKEKIKQAIITHCGSEIVKHDEHKMREIVSNLGQKLGVNVKIAYDGMIIFL